MRERERNTGGFSVTSWKSNEGKILPSLLPLHHQSPCDSVEYEDEE
jgi:hypothetical protein